MTPAMFCLSFGNVWILFLSMTSLDHIAGSSATRSSRQLHSMQSRDVCPPRNKYLHTTNICRPSEFHRSLVCSDDTVELNCPRHKYLAIYSASYGWNDEGTNLGCSGSLAPVSECQMKCVLDTIVSLCHGKRKCVIEEIEGSYASQCSSYHKKFLLIVHTCVTKVALRAMHPEREDQFNLCSDLEDFMTAPGHASLADNLLPETSPVTTMMRATKKKVWLQDEVTLTQSIGGRNPAKLPTSPNPARLLTISSHPTSALSHIIRDSSGTPHKAIPTMESSSLSVRDLIRSATVGPPEVRNIQQPSIGAEEFHSMSEWLWTWRYVNDNKEKFILYVLLFLSLGTIAVLVAILFHLVLGRRCRFNNRKSMSGNTQQITITCSSPTWRVPESESSTGDDRTLHDDDVELTSFNHIDSLQRRTPYNHQPCSPAPPDHVGHDPIEQHLNHQQLHHHHHQQQQHQQQQQPQLSIASSQATSSQMDVEFQITTMSRPTYAQSTYRDAGDPLPCPHSTYRDAGDPLPCAHSTYRDAGDPLPSFPPESAIIHDDTDQQMSAVVAGLTTLPDYIPPDLPLNGGYIALPNWKMASLRKSSFTGSLGRSYPNHSIRDAAYLSMMEHEIGTCRTLQPVLHYYG